MSSQRRIPVVVANAVGRRLELRSLRGPASGTSTSLARPSARPYRRKERPALGPAGPTVEPESARHRNSVADDALGRQAALRGLHRGPHVWRPEYALRQTAPCLDWNHPDAPDNRKCAVVYWRRA